MTEHAAEPPADDPKVVSLDAWKTAKERRQTREVEQIDNVGEEAVASSKNESWEKFALRIADTFPSSHRFVWEAESGVRLRSAFAKIAERERTLKLQYDLTLLDAEALKAQISELQRESLDDLAYRWNQATTPSTQDDYTYQYALMVVFKGLYFRTIEQLWEANGEI